jgi:hypothetical protein
MAQATPRPGRAKHHFNLHRRRAKNFPGAVKKSTAGRASTALFALGRFTCAFDGWPLFDRRGTNASTWSELEVLHKGDVGRARRRST